MQLMVAPLRRLGVNRPTPIDKVGSPESILSSIGPFITGVQIPMPIAMTITDKQAPVRPFKRSFCLKGCCLLRRTPKECAPSYAPQMFGWQSESEMPVLATLDAWLAGVWWGSQMWAFTMSALHTCRDGSG